MPQVEFHTGVASPLHFACRLLRKAWRQGVAVVVTAPPPALAALDRELWTFEPLEFVPHLRVAPGQPAGPALRRTAVWLCEGAVPRPGPQVLVNLCGCARAQCRGPVRRCWSTLAPTWRRTWIFTSA